MWKIDFHIRTQYKSNIIDYSYQFICVDVEFKCR